MGSGRFRVTKGVTAEQEALRELGRRDKDAFAELILHIKTKAQTRELIKLNYPQKYVRGLRKEQFDKGIPVRDYVLKSRQVGMSTDALADTYTDVYCLDNTDALIIAHDRQRASDLLSKCHLFYNHTPEKYKLKLAKSTSSALRFADTSSGLGIMTAANFEVQRGGTIHRAVASEFSFYPKPRDLIAGLNIVVPRLPGTQIIIETTAQGAGTDAHEFWQEAESGENGFRPIFCRWQDDPNCRDQTLRTDKEWGDFMEMVLYEFPALKDRRVEYDLTREQVAWYYERLKHDLAGNEMLARQEYPCSAEEAWLSSGDPIFALEILAKYRAKAVELSTVTSYDPKVNGEFVLTKDLDRWRVGDIEHSHDTYLDVWQRPIEGRNYIIGADAAAGYATSDFSSAFIIDGRSLDMVAEFHGRVEPHQFSLVLASLGFIYNGATIAPEVEGVGYALISHLREIYWNLYRWRVLDGYVLKPTNRIGWSTNTWSRPVMITNAIKLFLERAKDPESMHNFIRSKWLVDEMRTFCVGDVNGKPAATKGCMDDRVMAWSIALIAAMQEMYGVQLDDKSPLPAGVAPAVDPKYSGPSMEDALAAIMEPELLAERRRKYG